MFLLKMGANAHILDLDEKDCCDKAKSNGMAKIIYNFNNCSYLKK
jgi:hypothetical protein